MRRSQYATEYLFVVTFSALIMIPAIAFLVNEYSDVQYSISTNQAYAVARKISDSAMKVYYLGEGSSTTLTVVIPQNVILASLQNNEVLFRISSKGMPVDVYSVSEVNLTGTLPSSPGTYKITLVSKGDEVQVST